MTKPRASLLLFTCWIFGAISVVYAIIGVFSDKPGDSNLDIQIIWLLVLIGVAADDIRKAVKR